MLPMHLGRAAGPAHGGGQGAAAVLLGAVAPLRYPVSPRFWDVAPQVGTTAIRDSRLQKGAEHSGTNTLIGIR